MVNPLVSVIIVTKDRHDLFNRALESVVKQDYRPLEIIIVDNFSETPIFLNRHDKDIDFRIIRNDILKSASANRNKGLALARGEYLCLLDDDDYYLHGKISALYNFMRRNDSIDMAFCRTEMIGKDEKSLGFCFGNGQIDTLLENRYIHLNSIMMKKSVFDIEQFDEDQPKYNDLDFVIRVALKFNVAPLDYKGAVWNRDDRPDQITQKNYRKAYKSWGNLCRKFGSLIDQTKANRKLYYRKMFLLCIINGDLRGTLKYFWKYLSIFLSRDRQA